MCNNEALANQLIDLIERFGVDGDGRLDRERAKAYMLSCLTHANPGADSDDE